MNPRQLESFLSNLITHQITQSIMIWGAPGIGKSSIVDSIADTHSLEFIDIRLSQLAPTDLRGLPVADNGVSRWLPPEFLPTKGQGILFLDEINMAPPAMQGVAQQLILDRKVGSYTVPDSWFIWAAGNRKEDRASVFEMPAPLANRFIHLEIEPDFDSFKSWALRAGVHEEIIAFLNYRTTLLHKFDKNNHAWPSPRSWVMASNLHFAGLEISGCVGKGVSAEFKAFSKLFAKMPDVQSIIDGNGEPKFPTEPSMCYAMIIALVTRSKTGLQALNALKYLIKNAPSEWCQLYAIDAIPLLRSSGKIMELVKLTKQEPTLQDFMTRFKSLMKLS